MLSVPADLKRQLREHQQEHVLAFWETLSDNERQELLGQLQNLDLEQLRQLYLQRDESFAVPPVEKIAPVPVIRLDTDRRRACQLGEESLRKGEVAVLLVAGGQGSRLGFEHPKGMYAIGPVSNKSLFQIHTEKVLALSRRYGKLIPFLVMTSPATHGETETFFAAHGNFGLPAEGVSFFCQGTMPALDLATGKLLLEKQGRLFASPNGHGGTLTALAESGLLERLQRGGIRQVFYFQVDNPLVKVADPVFLGHHLAANAQVSSKVVSKLGPTDKLGNFVQIDGRCTMIEYSDLPVELAQQTDARGQLRLWAGSPAIHYFAVDFLAQVTQGQTSIPFHVARKKVPCLDAAGNPVNPAKENALKFERFIFDVLPLADRWTIVETSRAEEFVPLKNATGADSPQTVRQALSNLAADWLAKAGADVPRNANGDANVALEISPLHALDAEELAAKVARPLAITGPTYLGPTQTTRR
jgi:UDP-N-acetylglucosamine/UDP-N-acetylgalactosamine diphosphorylase